MDGRVLVVHRPEERRQGTPVLPVPVVSEGLRDEALFVPSWAIRPSDTVSADADLTREFLCKGRTPADDQYLRRMSLKECFDLALRNCLGGALLLAEADRRVGPLNGQLARVQADLERIRDSAELRQKDVEDRATRAEKGLVYWQARAEKAESEVKTLRSQALEAVEESSKLKKELEELSLAKGQADREAESANQVTIRTDLQRIREVRAAITQAVADFKSSEEGRTWCEEQGAEALQRAVEVAMGYADARMPGIDWSGLPAALLASDQFSAPSES